MTDRANVNALGRQNVMTARPWSGGWHLRLRRVDDSGKLLGLAPYGRRDRFDRPIFDLRDGRVFVRRETLQAFSDPARGHAELTADFQYGVALARWVQVLGRERVRSDGSTYLGAATIDGASAPPAIDKSARIV